VAPLIGTVFLVGVFAGLAVLGLMLVVALFRVTANESPGGAVTGRPSTQEQSDDTGG
jgi:hypothetical protein